MDRTAHAEVTSHAAARGLRQDAGVARRRRQGPGRLGHLPRCAVLRHSDSRRAGQVFLRVARRAGRLSGFAEDVLRSGQGARNGELRSFDEFIAADDVEQIHFIGKDIIYFHTLFWPAMLKFSGRKVPDSIYVHGFITVSGEKMSKSRGTGIDPLRYLELGMNPEWFRYYIAAKLNGRVEDIDFNPDDFLVRVNSDLIGKYVNIASRAANFISKHFGGQLGVQGRAVADPQATRAQPRRWSPRRSSRASSARRCASDDCCGPPQRSLRCRRAMEARQGPGAPCRAAAHLLKCAARFQAAVGVPGARAARYCKAHCARLLRHSSETSSGAMPKPCLVKSLHTST